MGVIYLFVIYFEVELKATYGFMSTLLGTYGEIGSETNKIIRLV